jgi:DNA-binding response OmpR family regulator
MCLHKFVNGVKLRFVNVIPQLAPGVQSKAESRQGRLVRILIVDDEPGVAMAMRLVLGLANCEAQIASTKKKAIEMAESGNFDLITLDVNLRGESGLSLCRELKRNPLLKRTPIVMISGRSTLEDQQNGLDAGAVDYITKPFNTFEFAPRLLSHIKPTLAHV